MTVSELAREAAELFETTTRPDGGEYVRMRSDVERPEWIVGLVRTAHGTMLPDDWRYATIREALEFIADTLEDSDDLDDLRHQFADQVDVYTGELLAWLQSNAERVAYCDQVDEEMGPNKDGGIVGAIGRGQYMERLEVVNLVLESLVERADS